MLRLAARSAAAVAVFAACLMPAATGAAEQQTPEEARAAMVERMNHSYAGRDTAILKIRDSVYLAEGESAWLTGTKGEAGSFAWTREEPSEEAWVKVVNDGRTGFKYDAFGPSPLTLGEAWEVSEGVLARATLTSQGTDRARLRVYTYDQNHELVQSFTGLSFFDYDPAYRIEARWEPAQTIETTFADTVRGLKTRFFIAGHAVFSIQGQEVRAPMFVGSEAAARDPEEFFFIFTDASNGVTTHGPGRFLDVDDLSGLSEGSLILDFNFAYNPLCARSKHYNCPLIEFDIPVVIEAGEKAPETGKE